MKILRLALGLVFGGLSGISPLSAWADEATPKFPAEQLEFFEKSVRPILVSRCQECHGSKKQEGALRLDSRATILAGGDTGPAIEPGNAADSLLISAINYGDLYEMPPKSKLPAEEIAALTKWVEMGAPWPAEESAAPSDWKKGGFDLAGRKASHWCWQPLQAVEPPQVTNPAWAQTPVDRFIFAKLTAEKLTPAEPAARTVLLRRLYFDLVGLPPTPAEVEAYLADTSPQATEKVVDRLLASPQFGERWGRHWLDLMRYAESRGHEFDFDAPNAYQYRDYVIRALNADVPYNQLVVEHLAGDLMPTPRRNPEKGFNESALGTGFWYLGDWVHSPTDTRKDESDRFENMIDVSTKAFLGLTVGCARCHDHKFDAISTEDFYALAGYLQSSTYRQFRFDTDDAERAAARQLEELRTEFDPQMRAAFASSAKNTVDRLGDYLAAAKSVMAPGGSEAELEQRLNSTARDKQLHPAVLQAWVVQLRAASTTPGDPLYLAAQAVEGEKSEAERIAAAATKVAAGENQAEQLAAEAMKDEEVVVDYSLPHQSFWRQNGAAFGSRPRRVGELRLSPKTNALVGVFAYGAAVAEPEFGGLQLASGVQAEGGRLRNDNCGGAGRMLYTPTFEIKHRQLHCLVRGAGKLYVEINSHRQNYGPLHGEAFREWDDKGGELQWISLNLGRYVGERVHVEFIAPTGQLEILRVVQSDQEPKPSQAGRPRFGKLLKNRKTTSLADVASLYLQAFHAALAQLERSDASADPGNATAAAWGDWMIRRRALFAPLGPESPLAALETQYLARRQAVAAQLPTESRLAIVMIDGSGEDENLFIRGGHKNLGDLAPRRFLEALGGREHSAPREGSGRLELAEQFVDPENPLASRVIVNRIWHHLFGRGIVSTVDNFGVLGQPPSHPELLDYLSRQFIDEGWSIKKMIRALVLTRAYQMASTASPEALERDPDNRWLQHARIRRLQGETIRDAILAVSGRLDRTLYGPSVPLFLTPFMDGRGRPQSGPLDGAGRRSIYVSVRRNFLSPMMLAFDAPTPFTTIGARSVSNVPAQALILMNDPFVVQQAGLWADRLLADKTLTPQRRIVKLYAEAFSRPPSAEETAAALAFLKTQGEALKIPPAQQATSHKLWTDLCHVMLNVKEFIFLE